MGSAWAVRSIRDLGGPGCVQTGPFGAQLHADDYVDDGTPLILIRNIRDGRLTLDGLPMISDRDAARLSAYALLEGDIVFSRVGRVGSCFLAGREHVGWIISGQLLRMRISAPTVDKRYVLHALQAAPVQAAIADASVGTTRTSINTSILERLRIPLPPLGEQRRIAEILDTIDDTIRATERIVAKLSVAAGGLRNALIDELFIVRGTEPLDRMIRVIDCKHYTPRYIRSGYPVVRPRNVKPGRLDFGDIEFVGESEFAILTDSHRPRRGDIVMSRNASFGAAALVDFDEPFAIGQDVVVLSRTTSNSEYIEACLRSDQVQQQIAAVSGGSTFGRINLGDIRQLRIPAARVGEQESVAATSAAAKQAVSTEQALLEKLRRERSGLVADLLSGRVRTVPA